MKNLLILWDIDGTLLHSGGAGMKTLTAALTRVFGVEASLADIDFAGRTDPWIAKQVLRKIGLPPSEANVNRYLDAYVAALPEFLASSKAHVLPGVPALLDDAASRDHVAQALLTGNVRRGAEAKLGFHGLWHHFPLGAFADDSEVRNELGPFALSRSRAHWGVDFPLEKVWIVGDTPHDIACARAIGARVLAVATGSSTAGHLSQFGPDAVLEDLSDADAFWEIVGR